MGHYFRTLGILLAILALALGSGGQARAGGTVTKTFRLTVYGTVPRIQPPVGFGVFYSVQGSTEPATYVGLCGPEGGGSACQGGGTVYSRDVEFAQGTTIRFDYVLAPSTLLGMGAHTRVPGLASPPRGSSAAPPSIACGCASFWSGTETISSDMTNTAQFRFSTNNQQSGAGDDQQEDDKDTGASDDEQVPDNQQTGGGKDADTGAGDDHQDDGTGAGNDTQDDVQDDQQAEMPEELPDTGAGGLATGASVPWGSLGLMTSGLLAAGYAVLRRR